MPTPPSSRVSLFSRLKRYLLLLAEAPGALTFWAKTVIQYVAPRASRGAAVVEQPVTEKWDFQRDRHPVREKHNRQSGWREEDDSDGLRRRDYADYTEYVDHQKQKLNELLRAHGGFKRRHILNYRMKFYRRFRPLRGLIPKKGVILCAGARQGTEVEVLRDLGFSTAYGIDLNPGPDNPFVRPGDFMKLENADASVDFFYTNCADHAFDLPGFFTEHARVLKPDGYAIYDLGIPDPAEGETLGSFEAVSWGRAEEVVIMLLRHFRELVHVERDGAWLSVMVRGGSSAAAAQPKVVHQEAES